MCSACSGNYEDPEMTQYDNDRESTEDEALEAIAIEAEQEQILEASRSVRAGTDMLFSALRKARVL